MGAIARARLILAAVAVLGGVATLLPPASLALPPALDADDDGWATPVESGLGSDPAVAASTPEHVAVVGAPKLSRRPSVEVIRLLASLCVQLVIPAPGSGSVTSHPCL